MMSNSSSKSRSLTFDEISNYFSLPLSDAATHLGVCVTALKKICRENGLDRWPYRKFLSGKSIEDIKRYAARERHKQLAVARQSGLQPLNNEMSKLHGVASPNLQQQGSKTAPVSQPHILLNASSIKGLMALDEFKYGFPLNGLSATTNKWWGSNTSDDYERIRGGEAETDEEDKHQPEEKADDSATSTTMDEKESGNGKVDSNIDPEGSGLLTAIRKRIVDQGREALKLGVYKSNGLKKLERKEKVLLLRIFKSSLPKAWIYDSA
ncbi:hypothetical protein ACOSQ2_000317 [Xanthoceras sorbifolium]|uniref:RWP-RK domain-containing protein n=1 Tax=Xanthoceras sorbifolium TaxID=99658 RepID=A0ABQ8GX53_9ROSI|nr:hypothetical protein JRO89_XSUnG0206400 [Xanthoceras sorbifolium]